MPITLSIVEDMPDTRENLVAMLGKRRDMLVLNSYATGEAALQGIPRDKPDVALIDINLPGISGIECVTRLKAMMPALEVLMVTTYEERDLIFNSLRAGAKGYVLKTVPARELIQAIEQINAGGAPMSMQIARKVVDYFSHVQKAPPEIATLTKREQDVLNLLAKGYLYKEIGDQLDINLCTVRTHLKHIYEKLHVQSRTEAAVKFLERR